MEGIFQSIYKLYNEFIAVMSTFNPISDLLDIIVVAFIIYKIIQLVRETRAMQLLSGLLIMFVIWVVSGWLNMTTLSWILLNVFQQGILAVAIIFQPEIRSALERVSRSNLSPLGRRSITENDDVIAACIDSVCKACQSFQSTKTGTLIVFERKTMLGDIIKTGTAIDSAASTELICNIFYPNTPLHDGAMIIRDGRVHAAGCILPLTQNTELKKELGTRHRASLGMSENSDAVIVVVSEETGTISAAINGVLTRNYNVVTLKSMLEQNLIYRDEENSRKNPIVQWIVTFGGGRKNNDKK